jgi:dTDP-4-dehydrorhamnose reductase
MSTERLDGVLTTGGSGMIGAYIDFGLRPRQAELDVTNESQVREYLQAHRPHTIIHLAAAADMVRCEQEPTYAYDINVRGTYNIVEAARAIDATVVYVSSSRVFKGDQSVPYTETDVPNPQTYYGRTKYIGEMIVASMLQKHIIARTSWVFGGGPLRDNKFYGKVLAQLQSDVPEVVALNDVYGSPTYAKDLISAIKDLLQKEVVGTFHITNTGVATRFDLAAAMAEHVRPDRLVRAVDRSFFPSASTLPTNESISSASLTLRPWQEALAEYLQTEWLAKG